MAFTNRVIGELRLLRGEFQQLIGTIHNAHEAQQQRQEQHPPVVRAELQIPEAVERERGRRDNRNYRLQGWLVIGTWLAFIAAAFYATVAIWEWREMIGTTDASYDSAKIARRGVALAAENAKTAEAALVENRREFTNTLAQLQKQTAAQIKAANAAQGANKLAADSFELIQRPWVGVEGIIEPRIPMELTGNNVSIMALL